MPYTLPQLEAMLAGAGVPRSAVPTLAAIEYYVESGGNPTATDYDLAGKGYGAAKPAGWAAGGGTVDLGLSQINSFWWPWLKAHGLKNPQQALLTPAGSAKATALIYAHSGFGPWSPDLSKLPAQYQPGKAKPYTGITARLASISCGNKVLSFLFPFLCNPSGPSVVSGANKATAIAHSVSAATNPSTWKKIGFTGIFIAGGLVIVALGAAELAKGPATTAATTMAKGAALA